MNVMQIICPYILCQRTFSNAQYLVMRTARVVTVRDLGSIKLPPIHSPG